MLLPLGDEPNPRGIPIVTYLLLAANIAAYVVLTLPLSGMPVDPRNPAVVDYLRAVSESVPRHTPVRELLRQISAYDLFVFQYGFRPAAPRAAALFTCMFLHAGFLHLFGNMLMLWIYGDNVEHRLGRLAYLGAYLGTGIAATLFHALFAPTSPLPLVGASGAISGILGFYFLWFPRNQVRLLLLFFPFLMDVVVVPARLVLGFYLIADNLLPFLLSRSGGGGVAHGAHIGGFVAGLAVAWVLDRRLVRSQPAEYRSAAPAVPAASPPAAVRDAVAAGRFADAARLYFSLDPQQSRYVLGEDALLELADWLRRAGHGQAALVAYRRCLRDYPGGARVAEAHLGAGLVQFDDLEQPTPAYQHFLAALDCDPAPAVATAAHAAIARIKARQKFQVGSERRRRNW